MTADLSIPINPAPTGKRPTMRITPLGMLWIGILALMLNPPSTLGQGLPEDFAERARAHVETIVGFGPRPAASSGENRTALYVRNQFHSLGLASGTEDFAFEAFDFTDLRLRVGAFDCRPVSLGLNPYPGAGEFRGEALLVDTAPDPDQVSPGSYLITTKAVNHFQLLGLRPKLVIYVSAEDFAALSAQDTRNFRLKVSGGRRSPPFPERVGGGRPPRGHP